MILIIFTILDSKSIKSREGNNQTMFMLKMIVVTYTTWGKLDNLNKCHTSCIDPLY